MDILPLITRTAERFRERLLQEPGATRLELPDDLLGRGDWRWDNLVLTASRFRYAHVETFAVSDRVSVLHSCVFAHLDDPSPIFGYDIVAGPSKVTGLFLDLSNTVDPARPTGLAGLVAASGTRFAERRTLPDWGRIFSPDILAIRPVSIDEVIAANEIALQALDQMLASPRRHCPDLCTQIEAGQSAYIQAQRQNQHTFRMLSGFVGADRARRFIDDVLFPSVSHTYAAPAFA